MPSARITTAAARPSTSAKTAAAAATRTVALTSRLDRMLVRISPTSCEEHGHRAVPLPRGQSPASGQASALDARRRHGHERVPRPASPGLGLVFDVGWLGARQPARSTDNQHTPPGMGVYVDLVDLEGDDIVAVGAAELGPGPGPEHDGAVAADAVVDGNDIDGANALDVGETSDLSRPQ